MSRLDQKHLTPINIVVAIIIIILSLVFTFKVLQPQSSLFVPPTPKKALKISSYLQTKIGQTTDKELEQIPKLKQKIKLTDGDMLYLFTSPLIGRDNLAITHHGLVVFERVVTIDEGLHQYATFTEKLYGRPESVFNGSAFYGRFTSHYIYSKKGYDLVVNPSTNEIYEISSFIPTSYDDFLKHWGADLKQDPLTVESFQ